MMSMNSAYVDELFFDFLRDPDSVSPEWRAYFQNYQPQTEIPADIAASAPNIVSKPPTPTHESVKVVPLDAASSAGSGTRMPMLLEGDALIPLSSISSRIAENMERSLLVPTATSVRTVPVKALEENRLILNSIVVKRGLPKLSFTHILAWAIVRALERFPNLNNTYGLHDGVPVKVQRGSVNLGLAVDTTRKDGSRILLVPSVKRANTMHFAEFVRAFDEVITKARKNKLTPDDLVGATVTLTNPGMLGTGMSMPRLMEGQGTIVATGSIEFPAEFQAVMPEVLSHLAISKVVNLTSTYDHRVIQGAESGEFLQYMHQLLTGEHRFYDQIFAAFEVPFAPIIYSREFGHDPFHQGDQPDMIDKEGRVIQMIHAYRVRGHMLADVNPLGLEAYHYPELDPAHYGLSIWDLDREFDTGGLGGMKRATLRDILATLRDTYCDQIGIEWMHIQDPDKRRWVRDRVETTHLKTNSDNDRKVDTYRKLTRAELLETFLHTKFLGAKRFSLEGGESALIILDELLENAALNERKGVVIGMAHRGRINVLANMMGKPLQKVFQEFEGSIDPESLQGSGDVKYHLGARGIYATPEGTSVPIFLAPNPSHLEAVDPVVEGIARAVQDEVEDESHSEVIPILVHGDAAFAGQGVVTETLNMSRLRGFSTGGTIHIIINNQIGFTTSPEDSRSTPYATGVAKMLMVPILHVNGDDPEACRAAAEFAFDYRERFHDDVVIDMYCYRKYGHNEQDDPTATQPLLYKKIRNMQPVRKMYGDRLVSDGVITAEERENIVTQEKDRLEEAYETRGSGKSAGLPVRLDYDMFQPVATKVDHTELARIADVICHVPEEFNIHPKVKVELEKRFASFQEGTVQWGMAEALAYGSLITEGHLVRLSGQDSGRGTFNHRQAIQSDMVTDRRIVPLNRLGNGMKRLHIYDSFLSEYAVLGFEYGYSTISKNGFTAWEAQFGDFANGAQIVIDQFIASAEEKWGQRSNLTLYLPHGYDGQGPEHSSARLERFLQLCAQDNMIVANYTSPANLFHAIRRQVHAEWRKPLVIMSPKGYLRIFTSTVEELTEGGYREIIDDAPTIAREGVRRVVLCSGKVHTELEKTREELGSSDVALVRLEQIYPFHAEQMRSTLETYPNAREVIWCQEEPANMGSWFFVRPLIEEILRPDQRLAYVGRSATASPATGSAKLHEREQSRLLNEAFGV
jgi:multifunctional 2-oxoglutarate metabolism enzyme